MHIISKCVCVHWHSEDTFFGLDTAGDIPVVHGPYMKSITVS